MVLADLCDLSSDQLKERTAMIRKEILPHVVRTEERRDGLVWEFDRTPELQAKLEQLVELERACCGGLDWRLQGSGEASTLRLAVTGADPRTGVFESFGGPAKAPESRGHWARLAGATGLGFGGSFFVCCVLPVGAAAIFGAAVVAPLAKLDNPLLIGAGSLALAVPAWFFLRRRAERASCEDGC